MLTRYPDYGKANPGYVLGLVEVMSVYPPDIQAVIAHPTTGIVSRCKYPPTPADITEMAAPMMEQRKRVDDLAARVQARRASVLPPVGKPPVRYFAPGGVEMTATEAEERAKRHIQEIRHKEKLDRRRAFTTELGNGNAAEGELIMLERGLSDVPADWHPQISQAAA